MMSRISQIRRYIALVIAVVLFAIAAPLFAWTPTQSLTHYTIDVTVDFTAGTFTGWEKVVYHNTTGRELELVVFRTYPNSRYLYGPGTLRVETVRVQDTAVASVSSGDRTVVPVVLPHPLPPQSATTVVIKFTGILSRWHDGAPTSMSDYGIYAANPHTLTMASFYPILAAYTSGTGWNTTPVGPIGDAVTSDVANYDVSVTVSPGIMVVGSGERTGITYGHDDVLYRFVGHALREFMLVVGDEFVVRSGTAGAVRLATYFRANDSQAATVAMADGIRAIAIYDDLFGVCAYPKVDIVEVPLARAAGVEYPGLILVGASYCADPSTRFFSIIISHELAHQWWYAAVGNDVSAEPWLDEALATYSSVIYLERTAGAQTANSVLAEFCAQYHRARAGHPDLTVASPTSAFPNDATYSAIVYSGGACFLNAIRTTIGDVAFFSALSAYYRAFMFRRAIGRDLLSAFTHACGCDLTTLYAAYLGPNPTPP